jgi:hypothetical protein
MTPDQSFAAKDLLEKQIRALAVPVHARCAYAPLAALTDVIVELILSNAHLDKSYLLNVPESECHTAAAHPVTDLIMGEFGALLAGAIDGLKHRMPKEGTTNEMLASALKKPGRGNHNV